MRRGFCTVIFFCMAAAMPGSAFTQTQPAPSPGPMALQVRSEFLYAWNAYKQYAWGHDELKPLSKEKPDTNNK